MNEIQRKRDERFMRMALAEAMEAAAKGEVPIGAVIVANERVIGKGHNLTETLHDVTAHAEMLALTAAEEYLGGKYLPDCTLYVTVEPCVMCAGALGWSHIGRIVYGAPDIKRGYFSWLRPQRNALHPKTIIESGVLEEECKEIMQDFFRSLRR
ncbi:MAG: nucleoside deaminase [Bacteroidales bacterium]|nr:nucleoside deaminase [Bacteroidales bacterium]MDE6237207.1 nucleoside deaminase [Muribaculaceae bacterium]MDE6536980.1 nucleoside deaminase [Muribaculaceae bacterium]MDE6836112.1 nucleoside deaminase [Muribaculaceae bacterium]MDE6867068.1 nucleoside deaminase [Muribaculaceae bacterium]